MIRIKLGPYSIVAKACTSSRRENDELERMLIQHTSSLVLALMDGKYRELIDACFAVNGPALREFLDKHAPSSATPQRTIVCQDWKDGYRNSNGTCTHCMGRH